MKYLGIVLSNKNVCRAISRIESRVRKAQRRITLNEVVSVIRSTTLNQLVPHIAKLRKRPPRRLSETGRGAKAKYGIETDRRILALLNTAPPDGCANWSGPLIAKALGDVLVQYVWRFLRAHKIDLWGRKSWCESNDSEFAAKAAEIVGLYMAPPENAIVLAVDEKPSIQTLERAQGYLNLPDGRAMTGQSITKGTEPRRCSLNLSSGEVVGRHYKRRRRVEFLSS